VALFSRLRRGLRAVFRRHQVEQERDDELRAFLETSIEDKMRGGMSRAEAARAARIELGSVEAVKDYTRDAGWEAVVDATWQDVRYAYRVLRRSPGWTVTAVLTLALGIGANAAMFAVVNALLLKPLPFNDPARLMLVHLTVPEGEAAKLGGQRDNTWSYAKAHTFLDVQQVFERAALFGGRDFTLSGDGVPDHVRGEVIDGPYFPLLGVSSMVGRSFTDDEASRPGVAPVAIISHSLWLRRYGGATAVLGRAVQINGTPFTIVGVLPRAFHGLSGEAEIFTPLATTEPSMIGQQRNHAYFMVARRKATIGQAAMNAAVLDSGRHVAAAFPDSPAGVDVAWGARAVSLEDSRADADVRRAAYVLCGAVACLLLIACVNLTSLLVAKGASRRREIAVRAAIGASRLRIARQVLTEGLVLALLGGGAGLLLADLLLSSAATLLPDASVFFDSPIAPGAPRTAGAPGLTRIGAGMIALDASTLLFTVVVIAVAGVMVAFVPALHASSLRPVETMKSRDGSGTRARPMITSRSALVIAQIAFTLVLLAGAGLMVRSAARLLATAIGVRSDVMTARVDLPAVRYDREKGRATYADLVARVRSIPGVESVALGNCPPVSGGCSSTSFQARGTTLASAAGDPVVGLYRITPDYVSTLGMQLLSGRSFTDADSVTARRVVLVNEAAARTFWPGESPIGKIVELGLGGFDEADVVGVVSNVRYRTIEAAATPDVYVPAAQAYLFRMRLFVRARLAPASLVAAMASELRAIDPSLPLVEVKSMDQRIGDAMWRTRIAAWLLSSFAGLALLLTAIGVFGVLSQTVTQRVREIGIRIALGARSADVVRLVIGRTLFLSTAGILLGVALALGVTRGMGALLYGVQPMDPPTLLAVSLTLAAVAFIAAYVPARRAARVDPLVALKYE
jgi:predicted permease